MKSLKDMEEPQMHTAKWKKPIFKGHILYDSNYIKFKKRIDKTVNIVKKNILMVGIGFGVGREG